MEDLHPYALVTSWISFIAVRILLEMLPVHASAAFCWVYDYHSFHLNHNKNVLGKKEENNVFCMIFERGTFIQQTMHLCVVKSHRISSFIRYSKLRHLHRKLTSSEHIIHGGIICIKVPGIYSYANVFSVLSVKWALIQSQIQCTVYISH